ncbi:MAG: single-stranded-DNA-specific exonuclease RecJ [Planctomycetota bacterium]|nr:single-stranded-DNA-specific exonuclease RecJ [Planctomycetota bacterium]
MVSAKWLVKPDPGPAAEEIAKKLGVSRILARILAQRTSPPTPENARIFLSASLGVLVPPWLMNDMEKAADRLVRAIRDRQPAIVYGDYDADGVTASALMIRACRAVGYSLDCRLPSRFEDGYGISPDFPAQAIRAGTKLVITVDCGTSEHENIARLRDGGVDVIVSDHHEPGERGLPPGACAVLNPKRVDSSYPFRELTGVGVAFKLAWAVYERLSGTKKIEPHLRKTLLSLLPLAAIGSIADVAPLVGENRSIVAQGLREMRNSLPGITALLEVCRLENQELTARHVAFLLAPRLNAAGRMGAADAALELLIDDDPAHARAMAAALDRQNSERQALCQSIVEEATSEAEKNGVSDAPAVVVARDDWHEGVIGIVAGRLAEKFSKPAAVIAFPGGQYLGRGSARSANGLNLYQVMADSAAHLMSFGGHELAAGFTLSRDKMPAFRESFLKGCESQTRRNRIGPALWIDMEIGISDLNLRLIRELDFLCPLGHGNPEPKFMIRCVRMAGLPQLSRGQVGNFHFNVSQAGTSFRAVAFGRPDLLSLLEAAGRRPIDIVFTPELNRYFSPPRLELRVEDLRPSESVRENISPVFPRMTRS